MINATNEKAIHGAEEELTLRLNRLSEKFPIDSEQFSQIAEEARADATESFLNTAINIQKHLEYHEKLEKIFSEIIPIFKAKNKAASITKCQLLLTRLFAEVETNFRNGDFAQPGGFSMLKSALKNVESKYATETR